MTQRIPGDPAVLVSSNEKAVGELGWELYIPSEYLQYAWDPRCSDLNTIVETACNRHKQHLEGY